MENFWDFNTWGTLLVIGSLLLSLLAANALKRAFPIIQARLYGGKQLVALRRRVDDAGIACHRVDLEIDQLSVSLHERAPDQGFFSPLR